MENNSRSQLLFFQPRWDYTGNLAFLTMTWEACRRWLNKMKFKILKYWSFENSTLDSNKLSPALKKEKVFFFFNAVLHFSKKPTPKVCYPIDLVSIYWNGIKVRLQVNDIGRGTNISIHVDSNFNFCFYEFKTPFSKVDTTNNNSFKAFFDILKKTWYKRSKFWKEYLIILVVMILLCLINKQYQQSWLRYLQDKF